MLFKAWDGNINRISLAKEDVEENFKEISANIVFF